MSTTPPSTPAAAKPASAQHWVPDARSAQNLLTLLPAVQPLATEFLRQTKARGWFFKITSAMRTYEEQNALYEQGRSKPGARVTNARGGYSNHNFGLAFDVTLFTADGKTPIWESPVYAQAALIGKALGLTWGGDWQSIKDEPHYELRPKWAAGMSSSEVLAELRARKSKGFDLFS